MSFNASSYFAGVGTVAVVMAIGFGAGLQMTGFFDDRSLEQPNKLERRAAGIPEKPDEPTAAGANAPVDAKTSKAPVQTRAPETTAPVKTIETKAIETRAAETKTIAPDARSVTAPEPPKPAAQPPMATSQRMRQAFDLQPGASQQPPQPAAPAPQTATRQAPSAASAPVASSQPIQPEPASLAPTAATEPAAPADAVARDIEAEKLKAEQQKAQQRKLAADRRRNREARLNAAAEWVRRQPGDIYAGPPDAFAAPRVARRDYYPY